MDLAVGIVVTATVFVWGIVSARLERADVTAPIVFTLTGALLAWLGLAHPSSAPETLKPLVEATLVWVLFSDAARVDLRDFRRDAGRYVRLLAIGLPLTVLAGWGLALLMFPTLGGWLTLLLAAALAPTDAALGQAVVTDPAVPAPVRRLIAVESGLNDGVVTPVVLLAIAGAASAEALRQAPGLGEAVLELAIGALVGVVLGAVGGRTLRAARAHDWVAEDFAGISVLALAVLSYVLAGALHGNGFIAAFCGGLAFGATAGRRSRSELVFVEQVSGLASLLVWLAFGAIAVPLITHEPEAVAIGYAVLSLTVVRMLPVALASLGSGLDRRTVLFVGWFGPRGLASLVFALIALEDLGSGADRVVAVVGTTVLLSVLAHGFSAAPLAARFARG